MNRYFENATDDELMNIMEEEDVQQENKQLQKRIEYLERSNNRREDEILYLRQELNDSNNKIDKAIEYIEQHKEIRDHYEPYGTPTGLPNYTTTHIFGYYELLSILKGEDNE